MKIWNKVWSMVICPRKNMAALKLKRVSCYYYIIIDFDLNEFCDKKFKADYLTY